MATALSVLRGLLIDAVQGSRYTGLVLDASCDTTSLIDTGLLSLPGGGDDDFCEGWYVILTTSTAGEYGETARVSSYSAAAWDITLATALTGSPSAGETFTLCRYDPNDLNVAINRAVELLYPSLYIPLRDETLITNNLLTNPHFETFSTTFTGWTHTANTWTQETSRVWHSTNSAKGVASGAASQLTQNLFPTVNVHEMQGKILHIRGRVWASDADAARLRVSTDGGSTFTSTSYHGGGEEWEGPSTMYIDLTIPDAATSLTVYCEVADGYTAYFDNVVAYVDHLYQYTLPSGFVRRPFQALLQANETEPDGLYIPFAHYIEHDSTNNYLMPIDWLPSNRIIRLIGQGPLSTMSTDAGTTEIDAPHTHLVVARAAQYLYEQLAADAGMAEKDAYERDALKWTARVAELIATPGMRMRRMATPVTPRSFTG